MKQQKKRVLLKLTGEAFCEHKARTLSPNVIQQIIKQIKMLMPEYLFGIVVGGGNFFRGSNEGIQLKMTPSSAHQVGILATTLNGIILKDLLAQEHIATTIFCAIECPPAGTPISQQGIIAALEKEHTLIFTGGTGNPFFTTDTNAILRGLQIEANQIWKGTKVDGIYTNNPTTDPQAKLLKKVSYDQALKENLCIMDPPALALARQYKQTVRVFNIFQENALIQAAHNPTFGSLLTT